MAINKVVNKSTKSHGAMRNVLEYVLRDEKVKEGYVEIAGPYSGETINYDEVYQTWLAEKRLWDKDSGRMYAHNIISFHKDEQVTPEQVLEIGKVFAEKFFSGHQYVIGVHQDKNHLHCHIVTNSVSYMDGMKLHQTKKDLEKQKEFTNDFCVDRGLSMTVKGKHFDGTDIEQGEIHAWSKDKYNLLRNDAKRSFVAECAIAIMETMDGCTSRDNFISGMEERGWHTTWTENKKHITFSNDNGEKVRDTNISKTFNMDVSKEALLNEFTRQNELRLTGFSGEKGRAEYNRYYAEVESAIAGANAAIQSERADEHIESGDIEDDMLTGGDILVQKADEGTEHTDTAVVLRELQAAISESDNAIEESGDAIRDSRSQNRAVRNTETESVAYDKQSHSREAERRLEEQRRASEQEAAREIARRRSRSRGWER